jgi:hypothetical protein
MQPLAVLIGGKAFPISPGPIMWATPTADQPPLALLIEIRTEPARREDPDRNERRGRILDVFDRGVRRRAGAAAATATGELQSVVLDGEPAQLSRHCTTAVANQPPPVPNLLEKPFHFKDLCLNRMA